MWPSGTNDLQILLLITAQHLHSLIKFGMILDWGSLVVQAQWMRRIKLVTCWRFYFIRLAELRLWRRDNLTPHFGLFRVPLSQNNNYDLACSFCLLVWGEPPFCYRAIYNLIFCKATARYEAAYIALIASVFKFYFAKCLLRRHAGALLRFAANYVGTNALTAWLFRQTE